jgi:hypothetical protein
LPYELELKEELYWNILHGLWQDNMVIDFMQIVSNRKGYIKCKMCMEEEAQLSAIRHALHSKTGVTTRDI